MRDKVGPDEIGYWSEVKLDIVKHYAVAYTTIMRAQTDLRFEYVYVDAFAGAGMHVSKATGKSVPGSPLNALAVTPQFTEYHFIDLDSRKVSALRSLVGDRSDVHIYEGDCNRILLDTIFPTVRWEDYRRSLCLLDPYGLHLNWEVLKTAGEMGTIEIFLNFPLMDINRNVLRRAAEKTQPEQEDRMNRFWGDDSWRGVAYPPGRTLFEEYPEKESSEEIIRAFQMRLKEVAGFRCVPDPMPMRNTNGAIVYYLFFASQKEAGERIARGVFAKYRDRGKK